MVRERQSWGAQCLPQEASYGVQDILVMNQCLQPGLVAATCWTILCADDLSFSLPCSHISQ